MIRTKRLAVAGYAGTGAAVLLYTVPAAHHAKVWAVHVDTAGAAGLVLLTHLVPGVAGPLLLRFNAPGGAATVDAANERAMEAGDQIYISAPVGTNTVVVISGTEYTD